MGRTTCREPQCLYSTAIPLLPLWAVRPVQSLSACTVQLYLYSSYGPYDLYRASVPVQYSYTSTPPVDRTTCTEPQCLYSTAITLLLLWTVRPVQSLSASTMAHFTLLPQVVELSLVLAVRAWQRLSSPTNSNSFYSYKFLQQFLSSLLFLSHTTFHNTKIYIINIYIYILPVC